MSDTTSKNILDLVQDFARRLFGFNSTSGAPLEGEDDLVACPAGFVKVDGVCQPITNSTPVPSNI